MAVLVEWSARRLHSTGRQAVGAEGVGPRSRRAGPRGAPRSSSPGAAQRRVLRLERDRVMVRVPGVSSGGATAEGLSRRGRGPSRAPSLARRATASARRSAAFFGARSPAIGSDSASAGVRRGDRSGHPVAARRRSTRRRARRRRRRRTPRGFRAAAPPPPPPAVRVDRHTASNAKVLQRASAGARPFGVVVTGEDGRDAVEALVTRDAAYDVSTRTWHMSDRDAAAETSSRRSAS